MPAEDLPPATHYKPTVASDQAVSPPWTQAHPGHSLQGIPSHGGLHPCLQALASISCCCDFGSRLVSDSPPHGHLFLPGPHGKQNHSSPGADTVLHGKGTLPPLPAWAAFPEPQGREWEPVGCARAQSALRSSNPPASPWGSASPRWTVPVTRPFLPASEAPSCYSFKADKQGLSLVTTARLPEGRLPCLACGHRTLPLGCKWVRPQGRYLGPDFCAGTTGSGG